MEKFDLVVIGAGPSGYAAAMRSLDFKKKTLLIEKERVGGAGVTNGALSSKTWWGTFKRDRLISEEPEAVSTLRYQASTIKRYRKKFGMPWRSVKNMLEDHLHLMKDSQYTDLLSFKKGSAKLISQNEIEISAGLLTKK
jgi:dihydrolipoamide dehydrogenase